MEDIISDSNAKLEHSTTKLIETTIISRFRQQVEINPEAIAIQTPKVSLTYEQLDNETNGIAWALLPHLKTHAGQIIILMEQNEKMIASILAVLATNHAYVPLDPSYPITRMKYIADDSAASVIVTDQSNFGLAEELAVSASIPIININHILKMTYTPFPIQSNPDSHAYLLYTSGTSGKPKGVIQNQRNVLYFNQVYTQALQINPHDRLSLLTSFCFDAAVMDIFAALLNGATLCAYPVKHTAANDCLKFLETNKITIYHSTPTVFRYIFENKPTSLNLSNLRRVVLGGEIALAKDWQLYSIHCPPHCLLVNGYGPTESSVTTQFVMNKDSVITTESLPIGYALSGGTVGLLPDNESTLKEIIIENPHIALGYWRMPMVSNKVFNMTHQRRQYHTGDYGRLLPNGALEYCGRFDDQVKIAGHRIELQEITHYILDYPSIKDVTCLTIPGAFESLQLAAFLVAATKIDIAKLRAYIKDNLPLHMIPTHLIQVDELPKTLNGKVDRDALTKLVTADDNNIAEHAVLNPVEDKLIRLCERLLPNKAIHIEDNIFSLGCNSLLAMQLTGQISQQFDIEFSIRYLFSSSKLRDLAQEISRLQPKLTVENNHVEIPHKGKALVASPTQKQFLFLSQLNNSNDFRLSVRVNLNGPLNQSLLQHAFKQIICRHDALRTVLRTEKNQVVQIIDGGLPPQLEIATMFDVDIKDRDHSIEKMIMQEANRSFDFAQGPLIRAKLLQYADTFNVLLLNCSHIIMDGWSLYIFSHELSVIYNGLINKSTPDLPTEVEQFSDYSFRQDQLLRNASLIDQRRYWLNQLADLPTVLTFRSSPTTFTLSSTSETINFILNKDCLSSLQQFSDTHHVTLFMTILSIFQIVIFHYSQHEDIVVGTPIANRQQPKSANIIGCLINMLALRGKPNATLSFLEFLEQIKIMTLDAYENKDIPFPQIVDMLKIPRVININPVFQVMFLLENMPKYDFSFADVKADIKELYYDQSFFHLYLSLEMQNDNLIGKLSYKNVLIDNSVAKQFVSLFKSLLANCISQPQEKISSLLSQSYDQVQPTILPELIDQSMTENSRLKLANSTRQQVEWNHVSPKALKQLCLHQWFEIQAQTTPDAIALIYQDQRFTYKQLNEKANQLAHHLIKSNVGSGVLVGVFLDPSLDLIVSIISILKTGAAYVPFDPGHPSERIKWMLNDTQAPLVITQSSLADKVQMNNKIHLVLLDHTDNILKKESIQNPHLAVDLHDLAYVIYTSGSTGRPKGVMIEHVNVSQLLTSTQQHFHFNSQDVWVLFHSPAFDFSVWEMWACLLHGGKLVLTPPLTTRSPDTFYALLQHHKVTVLNQTPLAFKNLMNYESCLDAKSKLDLRVVILAGDVLNFADLTSWVNKYGDIRPRLVNMYGITEACVISTYMPLTKECINTCKKSLIGKRLPDLLLYILDSQLKPVAVGEIGEIYIGGAGLARGYLNQPELTAERFIPNPFISKVDIKHQAYGRLYRSGDLARFMPDGNIEYMGRLDDQIKIRGYRVEIKEVENYLRSHPDIHEAIVLVQQDDRDEKQLVAYFTANKHSLLSASSLRLFLNAFLPIYMLPVAFIALDKFPINANGKINRHALPKADHNSSNTRDEFVPPSTDVEIKLANIWQQILNITQIGIYDNFFYVGGHSLLAMQMIALINDELHLLLPLSSIFTFPTIATFANYIDLQHRETQLLPVVEMSTSQSHPLSFPQERIWFYTQRNHIPLYNISMLWNVHGQLDYSNLSDALKSLVQRHETLRTLFVNNGMHLQQQVINTLDLDLPFVDLSEFTADQQENFVNTYYQADRMKSFDLSAGPLIRPKLFKYSSVHYVLAISIHHIIADGWSLHLLQRDWMAIYENLSEAKTVSLPALSLQYRDYAHWQQTSLINGNFDEHLKFWQQHLSGAPPLLNIPTDYPRPTIFQPDADQYTFKISSQLQGKLNKFSQGQQVSLFVTLLTAFYTMLHLKSNETDLVVGVATANRDQLSTQDVIGYFANTLALRKAVEPDLNYVKFLQDVNQLFLQAQDYKELPFEAVVKQLHLKTSRRYAPLFQVKFNLYTSPEKPNQQPRLVLSEKKCKNDANFTRLDMTWYVAELYDGIDVTIRYCKALFDHSSIVHLAEHWQNILEDVLISPDIKIAQIKKTSRSI